MKLKLIVICIILLFVAGCTPVSIVPENLNSQTYKEKKVNDGDFYVVQNSHNITTGNTKYFKFITNETIFIHNLIVQSGSSVSDIDFKKTFYISGTDSALGDKKSPVNLNKVSNNVSETAFYNNVIITSISDELFQNRYRVNNTNFEFKNEQFLILEAGDILYIRTDNFGSDLEVNIRIEYSN